MSVLIHVQKYNCLKKIIMYLLILIWGIVGWVFIHVWVWKKAVDIVWVSSLYMAKICEILAGIGDFLKKAE